MFQIFKYISAVALAATAVQATTYPSPESCSGYCWAHDPAVIQRASDGVYFKFNTGAGLQYASATSLNGPWTIVGDVLPDGSSISNPGSDDPWAPDITNIDGTYFLYYAVSTFGTQNSAIGLATSTTLEAGSWTDHGSVGVTSRSGQAYNAIDPNLFIYNGGAAASGGYSLLNFGSFYGDIYQVKLDEALTMTAGSAAYNIEYNSKGTRPCEGSYMFQYGSYYYLLWSHGQCCNYNTDKPAPGDEYQIWMCRSTTATGGFVDKDGTACTANGGSILLKSHGTVYGPGGQGVFTSTTEGLVLYYHYADTSVGLADADYLFGWNKLAFTNGWPYVTS